MNKRNKKDQVKGSMKDWIFQNCSTPMAVIAVILSIVALVLAIVLPNQSSSASTDQFWQRSLPDKETDCVNCTSLLSEYIKSRSAHLNLDRKATSEKPCCAENIHDLSKLLEQAVHVQETESGTKLKDNTNNSPTTNKPSEAVVAHKSFLTTKVNRFCKNEIKDDNIKVVTFSTENEKISFEIEKNIIVKYDGLEIKYPGMYYVYSSFKFHSNNRQTKELKTWHQYVYRDRKGFCESLLKTTHTTCQDCSQSKDTAFTGGVFHLVSGDVLRVFVSEQDSLDFKTEDSYLGALMLSAQ